MRTHLSLLIFALSISIFSHTSTNAQIILTVAGNGTMGYSGDGGPATTAKISSSMTIKCDALGNVFVGDFNNHRIRKVDTFGIITTFAGSGSIGYSGDGGSAILSSLSSPQGIAFDTSGNAYIADAGASCIRKVDLSGTITTIAGTPGSSGFSGDGGPAASCLLNHPRDISIDHLNNIYILDFDNLRIRMISPSGIISTVAGNGSPTHSGDGLPATAASFRPNFMTVDSYGNLYISTILPGTGGYSYIRKVNAAGIISTIAGAGPIGYSGDGGPATAATISCSGICVDTSGNVVFADGSNRVRMIDGLGFVKTIAGNGLLSFSGDHCLATDASMRNPLSVTCDRNNNIYVLDNNNFRVRKIFAGNPPMFIGGVTYHVNMCRGTTLALDTVLAANDLDLGQSLTWSIITPPTHGVLTSGSPTTSTGGIVLSSGFSYTPSFPYMNSDSFTVLVKDCGGLSDTSTITISVDSIMTDISIIGIDTICVGSSSPLTSIVGGGVWTSSAPSIATISSTGIITGISSGIASISYRIENACGTSTSTRSIYVKNDENCNTYSKILQASSEDIEIWPNPLNSENVNIRLKSQKITHVRTRVYNITGELLLTISSQTNSIEKITLPYSTGTYVVVADFDGIILKRTIILEK